MYIKNEQQHALELCRYLGIKVQLEAYTVNAYLRCVDEQEARAGAAGMDGTTVCG